MNQEVFRLLIVMAGGALGTAARYLFGGFAAERWGTLFPYGTFFINLSGCFVIGFIGTLALERSFIGPEVRLFLMVGILGGYTTFSSFGFETIKLLEDSNYLYAGIYSFGSLFLGILAVYLGMILARAL